MGTAAAIRAWAHLLGMAHVQSDDEAIASWSRATFPWSARPLAVLRPGSAEEAAASLAIAAEHRVAVHPVSRGRAWGLGSRLPVRDAVMLDLSRLDRILDVDAAAGTVRIEPGVTFRQLETAIAAAAPDFELPAFGGPPGASVLANALDRGEGMGARGDRFQHLWDLDVALTTGERLRTGWGRYPSAGLEPLHARPAGPLIEGLFSQSGFGCVLSGRLALAPRPAFVRLVIVEVGPVARIAPLVGALRYLLATRIVETHDVYLWDGAKRLSSQAIAAEIDFDEPLPFALGDWAASLIVTAGHARMLDAKIDVVREALDPLGFEVGIEAGDSRGTTADGEAATYRSGHSDGRNVTSCYWAKPTLPETDDLNPDRDRCGFLWLCPVIPFTGEALGALASASADVTARTGTFVAAGCEPVSPRALQVYLSLAWDRDDQAADKAAMVAHDHLFDRLSAEGWLPYRQTLASTARHPLADETWCAVTRRLRAALDPSGVLAPGRVPGLD